MPMRYYLKQFKLQSGLITNMQNNNKNAYIFGCIKLICSITIVPQAISYKVNFEKMKALLNLSTTVSSCSP